MNFKKLLIPATICAFALMSPVSAVEPFITFGPGVKVVFAQVEVDGYIVTQATATISETNEDGDITVKRQSQVVVPDGSGGFTQRVTQEETVATVTGPGVFSVTTTTDVLTTPLNASQTPSGTTTVDNTVVTDPSVDEEDLDLPQATTFTPIDEDLDDPIVVSPL